MNSSQVHLALTHMPVILSLVGLVVLVVAMWKRNDTLTKTAFYLLLFAGLSAIPVFLTGEGAEEAVERLPGVSETVIEEHEDLAKFAFAVVSAAALLSLAGLLLYGQAGIRRWIRPLVLLLALVTAGILVVTAHLGGQVRHTEIRPGFTPAAGTETTVTHQNGEYDDND